MHMLNTLLFMYNNEFILTFHFLILFYYTASTGLHTVINLRVLYVFASQVTRNMWHLEPVSKAPVVTLNCLFYLLNWLHLVWEQCLTSVCMPDEDPLYERKNRLVSLYARCAHNFGPAPFWCPKQNFIMGTHTSTDITSYNCLLVIRTPTVNYSFIHYR